MAGYACGQSPPTICLAVSASVTHQLPPAIAPPIANPCLPASFRGDDRASYDRFEDGADGGLADNGRIDRAIAQGLDPAVDALAGTGRIRGGAAKQQKRQCDKNRGHADLVANPTRVGRIRLA